MGRELARYRVGITALSETRLAEEGQLTEILIGVGYTPFWSGRVGVDRSDADAGFAVKNKLISKLTCLRRGVNDRLMTPRLPLAGNHCQRLCPHDDQPRTAEDIEEKFYDDINTKVRHADHTQ